MRDKVPDRMEQGRIRTGEWGSDPRDGFYGAFQMMGPCGSPIAIIASGGDPDDEVSQGWEHVSVSCKHRTPNWVEMCFVKNLCWDEHECVVQYHPPKSEYVNNHPYCLHLWRNKNLEFPLPPSIFVGDKTKGVLTRNEARQVHKEQNRP